MDSSKFTSFLLGSASFYFVPSEAAVQTVKAHIAVTTVARNLILSRVERFEV